MDRFVMPGQPRPQFWFAAWCHGKRWQRAVDKAVRPLGLGHTRYMLLDLAERIETRTVDAFMHRALTTCTDLSEPTVSYAMDKLTTDGLVDRDADGLDCRIWRVRVTRKGRRLLDRARPIVEKVAAELPRVDIDLGV